jgi:hypothetical protein
MGGSAALGGATDALSAACCGCIAASCMCVCALEDAPRFDVRFFLVDDMNEMQSAIEMSAFGINGSKK